MGPALGRRVTITLIAAATMVTWSCTYVPRDSGALERVRGGVLRVGVVEHPPWTVV
jgi:polar amino acid transport system substrate-binding protein